MRLTLLVACLSAATAIGCHHTDGSRQNGQSSCNQAGNGPCYQGGHGCRPGSRGNCMPECPQQPCIPGTVRIRKKPSPPAPVVQHPMRKPEPIPVVKEKPKPIRNVKFVPKSKFGHAKDFSWMVGQLRRVHVNGGSWKLRYAPIDVQDKWGGSVILSQDVRIERFKDGDFVYVEGEILATRPTVYLAGPLYRISLIRKATEADARKAWAGRLQNSTIRK